MRLLLRFRTIVAATGLLIAAITCIGTGALLRSKRLSFKEYEAHFAKGQGAGLPEPFKEKNLQWGVRTRNTRYAVAPDFLIPLVFILAWAALLLSRI